MKIGNYFEVRHSLGRKLGSGASAPGGKMSVLNEKFYFFALRKCYIIEVKLKEIQ